MARCARTCRRCGKGYEGENASRYCSACSPSALRERTYRTRTAQRDVRGGQTARGRARRVEATAPVARRVRARQDAGLEPVKSAGDPMSDHGVPQEVVDAWAKDCRCCPECSPDICGAVQQGAPCERRCTCDEDRADYDNCLDHGDEGDE